VFIWLKIRQFWEWKAAVDLAFASQARLAVLAGSSSTGLSEFIQNARVGLATWNTSWVPCGRISVSSSLESAGNDRWPFPCTQEYQR